MVEDASIKSSARINNIVEIIVKPILNLVIGFCINVVRLSKSISYSACFCLRCTLTTEGEYNVKLPDRSNCDTKPITPINVVSPLGCLPFLISTTVNEIARRHKPYNVQPNAWCN